MSGVIMRSYRSLFVTVFATFFSLSNLAQASQQPAKAHLSENEAIASTLNNGVELHIGDLHERVTALRDNVLRVRVWRGDTPPEDASWAVLPDARHSSVPVTVYEGRTGFRTRALTVTVNKQTLQIVIRDQSGNIIQQDARAIHFDGTSYRVHKTMPLDEHYFGLGDKTGPLDRRNGSFTLWNVDAYRFQESTDPIYKSIPYFMTFRAGRAAGVLLDNTWRTSFEFGKESPGAYSFGASAGPIDYYLFYGPEPKKVIETYAWLTGVPPLPPLWSFGFQQSRYSYMSQDRVLEVANRLRADHIPADAVFLDIDFQEKNRPFTVNQATFPDLAGAVAKLHAANFHVVAITDLHIANLPGQGYLPYETGIAGDHFVKNPDGTVYTGRVWPGPSVFPDFARQQTRAWWGSLYRDLKRTGIDGFWNDMNEPSVFDSPTFTMPESAVHRIDEPGFAPRTATHAEIHDVYGMENSRATFDGLISQDPDVRPFVLTRATYAGGQRYAATWTGDNSSSWNHLRLTTPMLENLGLSGFAFAGADVGGYAGTPTADLLTKWFEVGAFQPIDRDHSEKGTGDQEPWVGGPEHEAIRRHFIETRYQLMPYIYTLAEEASRTGLPLLRPLFLEFPDAATDHHPVDLDMANEFMFGPSLLVAPAPYPDSMDAYAVALPSTGWYDYWTGEKISAPPAKTLDPLDPAALHGANPPLTVNVVPQLAQLPVFVRAGSILPIAPIVQSTDETPHGALTLRVYAGNECSGSLYQDDGKTYAYRRGVYLRMKFACQVTEDALSLNIGPHEGTYPAWWTNLRVEIYGWKPAQGMIFKNEKDTGIHLDTDPVSVAFDIADQAKGLTLKVK
jgi:alpha-glucosidase